MKRRDFIKMIGASGVVSANPAFIGSLRIGSSETLLPAALDSDLPIQRYGSDGSPSFIFRYSNSEDKSSLEDWASSEGRSIVRDNPTLNMMTISASWEDIGSRQMFGLERISGGAQDLDYLEWIDANARYGRPDPIENLDSEEEVEWDISITERVGLLGRLRSFDGQRGLGELAFDSDVTQATLRDARNLVQASDDVLSGVDTSSATVAVIDTGIVDRSIYGDRILPESTNFVETGDPTVAENGVSAVEAGDSSLHGDWVSACIASAHTDAEYAGFAQNADILVAKSLDDDGGGEVADIVAGIELAIDQGADVICMSLGSPQWSQAMADALGDAWDSGIFSVVATGNDRYGSTFVASPASAERGFGVNATNVPESGFRDDTRISSFGNVGPAPGTQDLSEGKSEGAMPNVAAPGMKINIAPVGTLTGTSMAAPMVAGVATILASEGYSNEQIHDRIVNAAYPWEKAGETEAEHGLLDLDAALSGTEREDSQTDVRSSEAEARDRFNEALSASRGSYLARLF